MAGLLLSACTALMEEACSWRHGQPQPDGTLPVTSLPAGIPDAQTPTVISPPGRPSRAGEPTATAVDVEPE